MKYRIFEEDVGEGDKVDEAIKNKLHDILFNIFVVDGIRRIKWKGNDYYATTLQRAGIDGIGKLREIRWDTKVRDWSYWKNHDILIETLSDMKRGKPGWFYYSKADFVIYTWKNEDRNYLVEGYLIFIQNKIFRIWFWENIPHFKRAVAHSKSIRTGRTWDTMNRIVPIKDFPEGTILRFDPHVSLNNQLFFKFMGI